MNRCSAAEMRKSVLVVEQFKKYGIGFVAVPVRSEDHRNELVALGNEVLEELAVASEKSEASKG